MFKKLDEDPTKDPSLALLEYRNTPINKDLKSPNEIMFRRKVRGLLPIKLNEEDINHNKNIKDQLLAKQISQKDYYDKKSCNLKPLKINDEVYVRKEPDSPLVPAKVTKICNRPRSYEVELNNKNRIERNRVHIYGPVIKKHQPSNNNAPQQELFSKEERISKNVSLNDGTQKLNLSNQDNNKNVEQFRRSTRTIHKPNRLIQNC